MQYLDHQNTINALQVVERIKAQLTCEWQQKTVDTFKSGNPEKPIRGIAVTMTATMDVLKKANEEGLDFIITHEPTYYNHHDQLDMLADDPVLNQKLAFIRENELVIWRFHDHWHLTEPDGIITGMINDLGWKNDRKGDSLIFEFKQIPLQQFVHQLRRKFEKATFRIIGNPDMTVAKVGLVVGAPASTLQMKMLQQDIDVLVAGETREWETVEYVRDATQQGLNKALILLGHLNSEEAGMQYCSEWLNQFITEVPIRFIKAGDPFSKMD